MFLDKVQMLPHVEEGIRFSVGLELEWNLDRSV